MGSLGAEVVATKKKAMWLYPKVLGFNPPEKWGHSSCYSNGLVYVFGGCCGGLHFSDVLVLNLNTMVWNSLETTGQGPGRRDSHSAVVVDNRMIVFGGTNGLKKVNDFHVLDLVSKEWMQPEYKGVPPSPRESHTATLIGDEKLLIFGGSGEGEANYLNDLHVLDLSTLQWSSPLVKGDIPAPRDSHSAIAIDNKVFVYGGDCGDRYLGDVDVLNLETLTWSRLAVQGSFPAVRAGHSAVNIGPKVYVIGGVGDKHYYNDVWILDVSACSWTHLDISGQLPQGRFSHTSVVTESDIAIYGGCGEDERPLNELLILQLDSDQPNGRYNISLCTFFGNHWIQERRRPQRAEESNLKTAIFSDIQELETKQSIPFISDTFHLKRRRTTNLKAWEIESEQEEHSLSLSQHSSSSQSDQEQGPAQKATDSTGSQGFNMFKQLHLKSSNSLANNNTSAIQRTRQNLHFLRKFQNHRKPKQYHHIVHAEQGPRCPTLENRPIEIGGPLQNMIGSEVRGKVDAAFDSGFLMTATVNGKMFRGVLFAPGSGIISKGAMLAQSPASTSQIVAAQSFPSSNNEEPSKPSHQPLTASMPDSSYNYRPAQLGRQYSLSGAPSSVAKEPKLRSDLQGVVLTLGGPGSGQG